MAARNDVGFPPTKISPRKTKKLITDALDVLRNLNPRLRRYLRDFPNAGHGQSSRPLRDGDVMTLVDTGLLTCGGTSYSLTPLGRVARGEIWQAEQYIAEHYPEFD